MFTIRKSGLLRKAHAVLQCFASSAGCVLFTKASLGGAGESQVWFLSSIGRGS